MDDDGGDEVGGGLETEDMGPVALDGAVIKT